MSANFDKIIEELDKLTVVEMAELVKKLEEKYGVSAAAAVVAGPAAGAAAPVEEKTEFTVVLKEIGANKINVMKVVKEITGLGLVDAKNLVEKAPSTIKENVDKKTADEVVAKLKEAGAVIEIK